MKNSTRIALGSVSALILGTAFFSGCAYRTDYSDPCYTMKMEIKEKENLDAAIKKLAKKADRYRKSGDTASANSADNRLRGMRLNQKYLQESLEKSSADCAPWPNDMNSIKQNSYLEQNPGTLQSPQPH